ncbi:MAG: radical SAM protein [Acetobacteraceae bacterium]|nr:radical SAM protein [Acetobacteraceae bacterium]
MTQDAAAPATLHLELTGRCNLACLYCYNARFNPRSGAAPELGLRHLEGLLEEAAGLGYRAVVLSGGEPLLHPDFTGVARLCADIGLNVTLFTNASVPRRRWETAIEAPGLAGIRVSLDGLSAHDRLRPGSHWPEVVGRLDSLRKARPGVRLEVNTMLSRLNLGELQALYRVLKGAGVSRWNLDLPTPTGRAAGPAWRRAAIGPGDGGLARTLATLVETVLADGEPLRLSIRGMYDSAAEVYRAPACARGPEPSAGLPASNSLYGPDSHPCQHEAITAVRPSGDITRCPSHPAVLANLGQAGSLRRALEQGRRHAFSRLRLAQCQDCAPCRYLRLCGAGCRASALYLTGSDLAPDPVACASLRLAEAHVWPLLPQRKREAYLSLVDPDGRFPSPQLSVSTRS